MDAHSTHRRIAIFGATGRTGGATLRSLLRGKASDSLELRLFVRSKSKLLREFPHLESHSNVECWEGQLNDVQKIKDCLDGADIIICALGENSNIPGIRVLQGLSISIIDALTELQNDSGSSFKIPRLILLSSSTWHPRFAAMVPAPILWLIRKAFYYPYFDLRQATSILSNSPELLSLLLVHPPAIVESEPSGVNISTEEVNLTVAYADLGAGFAELATNPAFDKLEAVGVSSRGGGAYGKYGPEIAWRIITGLISGYVPGYWPVRRLLPW
ncbi:hypothetical protein FZEAL_8566 [Fusarium zealandicum]|uniref:NAD(P)-binding domain-containing protein n=1 Tax=Fusarium zealandicum TaxID=1053134 RepID=A0A8H4XHD3_9HYPO|nr:hypothetical protein FZEAL_8566 [Fusarium zealandicum]